MSKYPYLEFYPNDWKGDPSLQKCSLSARGVWIELIGSMHLDDRSGIITGTSEELSRLCGCRAIDIENAIAELKRHKAADVTICGANVTIINRRMRREHNNRISSSLRKTKERIKKGKPPLVTPLSRPRALNPQIPYSKYHKENITKEIIEAAEKIRKKHPRITSPTKTDFEIVAAIEREIDKGMNEDNAIAFLEGRTELYAECVEAWPLADKRFIKSSEQWFSGGCYLENPESWKFNQQGEKNGNSGINPKRLEGIRDDGKHKRIEI